MDMVFFFLKSQINLFLVLYIDLKTVVINVVYVAFYHMGLFNIRFALRGLFNILDFCKVCSKVHTLHVISDTDTRLPLRFYPKFHNFMSFLK